MLKTKKLTNYTNRLLHNTKINTALNSFIQILCSMLKFLNADMGGEISILGDNLDIMVNIAILGTRPDTT